MKILFLILTTWLLTIGMAMADGVPKELKVAFEQSRAFGNIDLILPTLLAAKLYVVVHEGKEANPSPQDYYLVSSPNKERMCVTVSERLDNLEKIKQPKVITSGLDLLKYLPPDIEIVLVYKDGGDYLSKEQLNWYRHEYIKMP